MTKRAEKVYLSFFEGMDSNQHCIANTLRTVAEMILPEESQPVYSAWKSDMLELAKEMEDLDLDVIYGEVEEEYEF